WVHRANVGQHHLYDVDVEYPLGHDPLPAGAQARFDVSLEVPREFAAGRHALAVEVSSDRRDERPVLTGVTVDVSSIQKVALRINPGNIRGHRTGRFRVELDNLETHPVDLSLEGHGQDVEVGFGRKRVQMQPGDSVSVSGTVRGNRGAVRDSVKHLITVSATGRSQPIYAEASFEQRPLIARRFRSAMAVLALLGLWAGILGGAAYWYAQRDDKPDDSTASGQLVDTDGDGIPDAPLGSLPTGTGADGSGTGGQPGSSGGNGGTSGSGQGAPGAPVNKRPTSTVISGTVKAGETGNNSGVTVTLVPATLGGTDTGNDPARAAALSRGGTG
ncbi:MAG TPA: hypothetical protein PLV68_06180, partial [Ilumatobacteraceae bacterium]|nr:hypothetical protein [Ilumatobacteraceae bacterium]